MQTKSHSLRKAQPDYEFQTPSHAKNGCLATLMHVRRNLFINIHKAGRPARWFVAVLPLLGEQRHRGKLERHDIEPLSFGKFRQG